MRLDWRSYLAVKWLHMCVSILQRNNSSFAFQIFARYGQVLKIVTFTKNSE